MIKYKYTGPKLSDVAEDVKEAIEHEMESRTYRASNELRNAALLVLRGQRSGRRYKVPGTYKRHRNKATGRMMSGRHYTASAPGEPPAVRTGAFRLSWQTNPQFAFGSYIARIESDIRTDNGQHILGEILENGTSRMEPRPYKDRIIEKAEDAIIRIYEEPYNV